LEFSDGWLKKIVYLIHGVLNSCKASNIFFGKNLIIILYVIIYDAIHR
jgi:hypothetical protein